MHTKVINFLSDDYTTKGVINCIFSQCNIKIEQWLEATEETTTLYDNNPFIDDPNIIEINDVNISDISAGDLEFLVTKSVKAQINDDDLKPVYTITEQLKLIEKAALITSTITSPIS